MTSVPLSPSEQTSNDGDRHGASQSVVVLGSRSPRRLELLSLILSPEKIRVIVPQDEREAGFEGLTSKPEIFARLAEIARTKNEAVFGQLQNVSSPVILTADTIVIVTDETGSQHVLGKPDGSHWKQTTRDWFTRYYSGKTHFVVTGVCLRTPSNELREFHVLTAVRFHPVSSRLLEWYLDTEEPLGKAGGYGLQGAASLFVESVTGSLSNVIGLPLEEIWTHFQSIFSASVASVGQALPDDLGRPI